jgi:hypothetical protein
MTLTEAKLKWFEESCTHTEAELLRQTVEFINSRPEHLNNIKGCRELINDFLRDKYNVTDFNSKLRT